jgi:DNA-binding NtrC family response regulator
MMSLSTYRWPGNVRELENVLTRFIVTGKLPVPAKNPLSEPEVDKAPRPLKQRIQSQAIAEIRNALTQCGGNKRRAAELLGISRAHLYRLMKEQDLHPQ